MQYTIDFEEWGRDVADRRPSTPANSDMRSAALRDKLLNEGSPFDGTIYYISLGSGSSGNSCYVGTRRGGVIIDAGVRAEVIVEQLTKVGISMDKVQAVLLTHDHTDHSKFVYTLLRTNKHLKLYCTNRVLNALLRRHNISHRVKDYHVPVYKEFEFKIGDFAITAFDAPHDAADNAGYHLQAGDSHFVLATDMGEVSERADHYMRLANFLVIEANYDSHMLANGPYPEYLKARIRTDHGHLDNVDCAAFLCSAARKELTDVFLCHLSKDNNTPRKALETIRGALEQSGVSVGEGNEKESDLKCQMQLMALPRFEPTRLFRLRRR